MCALDIPNLDDTPLDDLISFEETLNQLQLYVAIRREREKHMLDGWMEQASDCTDAMDRIYKTLPASVKW